MLIPSVVSVSYAAHTSLSRRVNANSQREQMMRSVAVKLIKKGEC